LYVGFTIMTRNDKVIRKKPKKQGSSNLKAPAPDTKALGYCVIDTQDLFSGSVYDYKRKQMTSKMSPVPCSTCNQYLYKTGDQCSPYRYNREYNYLTNVDDSSKKGVFCDPAHPERDKRCIKPHGVCTLDVSSPSKTCNF
jgi:hypothetical protein